MYLSIVRLSCCPIVRLSYCPLVLLSSCVLECSSGVILVMFLVCNLYVFLNYGIQQSSINYKYRVCSLHAKSTCCFVYSRCVTQLYYQKHLEKFYIDNFINIKQCVSRLFKCVLIEICCKFITCLELTIILTITTYSSCGFLFSLTDTT